MKSLVTTNELNKILRNQLIQQSELAPEMVLNSLSLYGADLDKHLQQICSSATFCGEHNNSNYGAITYYDALCLFELQSANNSDTVSYTDSITEKIIYYRAFVLKVILYGDNSDMIATKIVSRFRSERVRNLLYDDGVYLEEIDSPLSLNEFKNNSMWLRTDFNISIACKIEIPQLAVDDRITKLSELNVILPFRSALFCSQNTLCGEQTILKMNII